MRNDVRQELIRVAKNRRTVRYKELMTRLHISRRYIGGILFEISEFERAQNRPLLSSIVVRSNSEKTDTPHGEPGPAFFGLACLRQERPDIARQDNDFERPLSIQEKKFIREEQERVWAYWARNEDPLT